MAYSYMIRHNSVIIRLVSFKIQIRDPYELLIYGRRNRHDSYSIETLAYVYFDETCVAYASPRDLTGQIYFLKLLKCGNFRLMEHVYDGRRYSTKSEEVNLGNVSFHHIGVHSRVSASPLTLPF